MKYNVVHGLHALTPTPGLEREMVVCRGPNDDPNLTDEQLVAHRTAWFHRYVSQRNVFADAAGGPHTCPCCGHLALSERGSYEICDECDWEDDGQDDHDAGIVRGGPNGRESLDDARQRYIESGGARGEHRAPNNPS